MTIQQIKSKLSILTVLSHYGLEMDRNGMLCCPFHEDGKASMKVYEETNTVYCFAGSCKVSNLDTIDFIMLMEQKSRSLSGTMDGSSKHEAIKKAKQMAGEIAEAPKVKNTKVAQADPVQDFNRYLKAFAGHKKAQEYCEARDLAWKTLEIGYKSRKAPDRWSRGCIIFPLKNEAGQVVSLYGRSIFGSGPASAEASAGRHYYQSGRSGLYPAYPAENTRVLLLTESVIDAATLLPLELDCSILALYGTNGLSEEHQSVIRNLMQLKEVILAMDGDEAGRPAGEQIARAIKKIRSSVKVSRLEIAEGEDAIIFGTVISKEDNKPIPNAAISIVNSDIGAITSGQGMFSIPITPGRYHLICNAVGYDDLHIRKAIVEKGKSLEITVKLGTTKIYQK